MVRWNKAKTWISAMIAVACMAGWGGGAVQASSVYEKLLSGERVADARSYETPEQQTVYLTFDDGPSALTEQVLDVLKQEQVPATFFVLGQAAEQRPEMIERMIDEGHAIGNHTYDHQYDKLYESFDQFWGQVERTGKALSAIAGYEPRLLRAPGGTYNHFDAFYFYLLEQAGYRIHDWNVDAGDSRRKNVPKEEIVRNVKKTPLKHEMTVLLHDSAGHAETVRALPDIIRYYRDLGYRFAVIDERVQPEQLSLKPPFPRRSYSESQFFDLLETVRAAKPDPVQASSAEARRESAEALFAKLAGNADQAIPAGFVPLREWAEQRGGQVLWDQSAKTATVYLYHAAHRFNAKAYLTVDRKLYVPAAELQGLFPSSFALHSISMNQV